MDDESETMKYGPSSINISTKTRGELQRENEELRESLSKLHAEIASLKAEKGMADMEIERLKAQIDEMRRLK